MKKVVLVICLALFLAGLLLSSSEVQTTAKPQEDKVTICHAAGRVGTTHYIELTIGYSAVFGPGGHFNENGTPQAGHELDYLGPCGGENTDPL